MIPLGILSQGNYMNLALVANNPLVTVNQGSGNTPTPGSSVTSVIKGTRKCLATDQSKYVSIYMLDEFEDPVPASIVVNLGKDFRVDKIVMAWGYKNPNIGSEVLGEAPTLGQIGSASFILRNSANATVYSNVITTSNLLDEYNFSPVIAKTLGLIVASVTSGGYLNICGIEIWGTEI